MIELLDSNVFGESSSGGGNAKKYNITASTFLGDVNANGVLQEPSAQEDLVLTGVKDISTTGLLSNKFAYTKIKSITAPDLEQITGVTCLNQCFFYSGLKSASFPKLTTISGQNSLLNCFNHCESLESIDFSELTTLSSFGIFNNAFQYSKLKNVSFPKLATMGNREFGDAFDHCSLLESILFPSVATLVSGSFEDLLTGTSGVTLHFPAAMKTTIEGLTGYPNFSGTNVTVLFDL